MVALAADFDCPTQEAKFRVFPVAANVIIFAGALVALSNGVAQPGATALGLTAVGRAEHQVSNAGGAAGALEVRVRRGVFLWNNSIGADAITEANIGQTAYIVDDNTVALTNGTGTRSAAGRIYDIDPASGNPWIEVV